MERIFLIGFMGSGKTTLGKALAQKLGVDFIDLDLYIETRYHKQYAKFSPKAEKKDSDKSKNRFFMKSPTSRMSSLQPEGVRLVFSII